MTAELKRIHLLHTPLEETNLIEASAGTGKTYTITGLFLRLLLEKGLRVHEILVVTFTEAATGELKERIRGKIREAIEAFSKGSSEDDFLCGLVKEHAHPHDALKRLREALRSFDQSAIFTIHGFCRRMLYESAFESGSLFDTELITDEEDLKREIVEDFWRTHFYKTSPLFINYALFKNFNPSILLKLLNNASQLHLRVIPATGIPDSSRQEEIYRAVFKRVCTAWEIDKMKVRDILENDPGLNRSKYPKKRIPDWTQNMEHFLVLGENHPILFDQFSKFTSGEIRSSVKKGHTPPSHPFFDFCEELEDAQERLEELFDERLLGLKVELFHYAKRELARRKEAANVLSFDDLLVRLHKALERERGNTLAQSIREKFKAALIDEFQDTDPIQYAIFKKIFSTKKSILFLIGDPKQAIYGFRGADIFAYMAAGRYVKSRYTLDKNWRSEASLITATNTLFTNVERPFVFDEIPFETAEAAHRKVSEVLEINGEKLPPFQLWVVNSSSAGDKPKGMITGGMAKEMIPRAIAMEISRLLHLARNGKATLGDRPLRENDIAVLVRKRPQPQLMQQALSNLGIHSVIHTTENLFDSHEAMEVERLLMAIVEPNHEGLLRGALTTDLMGVGGQEIEALMRNEAQWEKWLLQFREYHDLWNKHGFICMFRSLLMKEQVLLRLMSFPDGERRNTNVLHLSEVLHRIWVERKTGMTGLLKWLSEQRNPDTARLEEHQLRLESDENAVKIVTIHKSKGLEYSVVFCPFTWESSRLKDPKAPFTFHDEKDGMELTLDLGSPEREKNKEQAEKELLAENLRLLYVAITRAKNRCYLVWGRFNKAETSAPAYIFHSADGDGSLSPVEALSRRFMTLTEEDMLSELSFIRNKAPGSILMSEIPSGDGEVLPSALSKSLELSRRLFTGSIDGSWNISSYSSLMTGQWHRAELGDRDEMLSRGEQVPEFIEEEEASPEEQSLNIFSFPRGARAGMLLHDIFEHLDFTRQAPPAMEELVSDRLEAYGFDPVWGETLCEIIPKVLSTPLNPNRKDFTFSCIPNQDRLNELEFYFPLKKITVASLKRIFARHGRAHFSSDFPERIGGLNFSPVRGFMKGFIDMVFHFENRFYLVDWKSNFLGPRVEDYNQAALAGIMEQEHYILQYHIYAVALHQYLRMRLRGYDYETHFGDVLYIFLRGMDPLKGPDFGIFRARPSKELIDVLREELVETGVQS